MKIAQVVITRSSNGFWKMTTQSDYQVERCVYGTFEEITRELKDVSIRDWWMRSDVHSEGNPS